MVFFLHSFLGQQTFGIPCEILDQLMIVFEVCRLPVQINNVAHLSISIQGPVSIAWQRRATAPGDAAGVVSRRPRVIEVGSGGLIRLASRFSRDAGQRPACGLCGGSEPTSERGHYQTVTV